MSNPLGDLISRGEGGYNSYNRGTANGHIVAATQRIDFGQMSLDELRRRQALPADDPDRIFAVGKYQLIPKTLANVVSDLGLQGADRLTPELQERIFAESLIVKKRPQILAYIQGTPGATLHSAQKATCQEWASVDDPDTPGRPYNRYGQQGNHSSIRASQVAAVLDEMRADYQKQVELGASSIDAWRSVTGQSRPGVDVALQFNPAGPHDTKHAVSSRADTSHSLDHIGASGLNVVQQSLFELGYDGLHGCRLALDGTIGPNTLHAIKSFQHAHHLHVDGIVGPRTLAALEEAKRYPLLSEATNPHHSFYAQVVAGIHKLPQAQQPKGRELENTAVALTLSAVSSGLGRVDHAVLGRDGVNLFAVRGRLDDPSQRRTYVALAQAAQHDVDHRAAMAHPAAEHVPAAAISQHVAQRPQVMAGP